jgi:hypothetical protein
MTIIRLISVFRMHDPRNVIRHVRYSLTVMSLFLSFFPAPSLGMVMSTMIRLRGFSFACLGPPSIKKRIMPILILLLVFTISRKQKTHFGTKRPLTLVQHKDYFGGLMLSTLDSCDQCSV